MKHAFTTVIASLALASLSQAAVYSITNLVGDSTVGITQSNGKPGASATVKGFNNAEAIIQFGVFDTGLTDQDIASFTSGTDLYAAFNAYNNNVAQFGATTFGNNGTTTVSNPDYDLSGPASSYVGKNIYVLVANVGSTGAITDSTEFLVLKLDRQFQVADDTPASVALTFDTTNSTLIVGEYGTYSFKTRTSDTTTGAAWNTVLVPEPSAALLGMLGALGLLRRRR